MTYFLYVGMFIAKHFYIFWLIDKSLVDRHVWQQNRYWKAIPAFNEWHDFNAAVRVAVEYEHAKSDYFGIPNAAGAGQQVGATADNGQINTFRLCAMYFF